MYPNQYNAGDLTFSRAKETKMDKTLWRKDASPDDAADWATHTQSYVWTTVRHEAEALHALIQTREGMEKGIGPYTNVGFRETQVAYVLRCFAMIDRQSQAVWGGKDFDDRYGKWRRKRKTLKGHLDQYSGLPSPQTWRMTAFLNRYLHVDRMMARLAVDMYRHTPIHEGHLHYLHDSQNRLYKFSLGWEVARENHFRIRPDLIDGLRWHGEYVLQIGILTLIRDIEDAIEKYVHDIRRGGKLCWNFLLFDSERWNAALKWTPQLQIPPEADPDDDWSYPWQHGVVSEVSSVGNNRDFENETSN